MSDFVTNSRGVDLLGIFDQMSEPFLNRELRLPCGTVLRNRLVKSAMTERISSRAFEPTEGHGLLYRSWANTGAGLLITGNVSIDRVHLESAGNVCLDDKAMIPKLQAWSKAGKESGNHLWVQISHAGRQTNKFSTLHPLAPSDVQLKKLGLFGRPKVMEETDIEDVVARFVRAAMIAKEAGFNGVQFHAAHGYLLSQFLSSRTNVRADKWGGSIENRSRLLMRVIHEAREALGPDFPISVKLNSSDFQRGGFTEDESLEVVKMLDGHIDLLEISGGTYEKVVFFLKNEEKVQESTQEREAYFIDFAKKIRTVSKVPLMITGGFRSYAFCNEVLEKGELDLIGMARPFITDIENMAAFLRGEVSALKNLVLRTGILQFDDAAEAGFYARQLIRLAKGKPLKLNMSPTWCCNFLIIYELKMALLKKMG